MIGGIVTFQIVEGVLSEITVVGAERLAPSYIEDRIRLSAGPPLNVNPLQERLRLLLEDPLIERIDAELGPGVQPGEAELTVTVVETPAFSMIVGVDNYRVPSVGAEELQGQFVLRDLAGQGETVVINPSKTAGLTQIDILGEVPITVHDTRLLGHMEYGDSQVIEGDFSSLGIEGETFEVNFGLRHPVYRTPGQELALSLTFNWRRSLTFLDGERFSFSPGVDDGKSVVSVIRGAIDWLERSQNRVIAARSTFSGGVDVLGATTNPGSIPDGRFFSWLGQAQMVQRIDPYDLRLVVRGEAQLTPDRLLPLEKCAIGGIDTVRGYRKDFLVRDNCWAASAELRIPVFNFTVPSVPSGQEDGRVDFAPFFDAGQAWDTDIDLPGPKTLMSVGAGLRWAPMQGVLATLYYGYRIKDVDEPDDSDLQDHGILFSLEIAVF